MMSRLFHNSEKNLELSVVDVFRDNNIINKILNHGMQVVFVIQKKFEKIFKNF